MPVGFVCVYFGHLCVKLLTLALKVKSLALVVALRVKSILHISVTETLLLNIF